MLILLCLLAAFSSGAQNPRYKPSFPRPRLTACKIVTRAEVEDAVGRPMSAGSEEIEGPASTCDYGSRNVLVSIVLQRLTGKPNLQAEIAALRKEIPAGAVRDAPAFPDAFYFDVPDAGTQLHILNGSSEHLMISVLGLGDPSQVSDAAARIARKAMKRL